MPELSTALLNEIDPLPYPERKRLLARRAREQAGTPAFEALLAELSAGDPFHRELGLFLATVAGRREAVAAGLADPDPELQSAALRVWLRSGPVTAGELWELLADAPARLRRTAYRTLRKKRLSGPVSGIIDRVRERYGDAEAATLLATCDTETVTRLLPELAHAIGSWPTLGRKHPAAVLDEVERQLAGFHAPGEQWWVTHHRRAGTGFWAAAELLPRRALDLLDEHTTRATGAPGPYRHYHALATADPHRVLRLFTAPGQAERTGGAKLPSGLWRRLAALDTAELAALARLLRGHGDGAHLARLLAARAPRDRAELFDAAYEGTPRDLVTVPDEVLELLPHARRAAEARRLLGLAAVRADEHATLRYHAFLPWAEAKAELLTWTRRASAPDRASGWRRLVACAARSRDAAVVTEALTLLGRLRNEQFPVRHEALAQLAEVNPLLLELGAAELLDRLVLDETQARDSAAGTREALKRLAVAVLQRRSAAPELAGWALRTLSRLFGDDRLPSLYGLGRQLRRGQEKDFFAAVRDWVTAAVARGRYGPLFAVATGLDERAWRLPELQEMLQCAINRGNVGSVIRQAVQLWLADPATRGERVAEVLAWDPSTVDLPHVWSCLATERTDLLDTVLGDTGPTGMFLSAGTRWVPPYAPGVRRWLPRHQRRYLDLLTAIVADPGTGEHRRATAIREAAYVPDLGRELVVRHLGAPSVVLAEAALYALVWTDRPGDALPALLAHAAGDRARVAVYAAARAAAHLRPSELRSVLAAALGGAKVTSQKEILRLAARFAVPDAGGLLLDQWQRDGLHRDVRTAIVSAARQHPEWPQSWQILAGAVHSGREDALALLAAAPEEVAAADRERYGALVAACCDSADPEVAYPAWLALAKWDGAAARTGDAAYTRLTDLADRLVWRGVATALALLTLRGEHQDLARRVLSRLIELDRADDDTDPEADRPARRRLEYLVGAYTDSRFDPPEPVETALQAELGTMLLGEADHVDSGARLSLQSALGADGRLLPVLAELAAHLATRPAAAARLLPRLKTLVDRRSDWSDESVLAAATALAARPEPASGQFAVVLAARGARGQWPRPWRELVRQLRRHADPDVREAAYALRLSAV